MIRQSISKTLLIVYIACLVIAGEDDMEERIEEAKIDYMLSQNYCTIDEFEELDYYLYCDTWLGKGASGYEIVPAIINNKTQSIEEAKELYQAFKEQLPLEPDKEDEKEEKTNVINVSPDCRWVVTLKWDEYQTQNTQTLFYQKEKIKEAVEKKSVTEVFLIIKDEDTYKEMGEQHYKRLSEIKRNESGGYFPLMKINATGDLIAGTDDYFRYLTIRTIADGAEYWRFSLQEIQEELKTIRDDVREDGLNEGVFICQFEGDQQEGYLLMQAGLSSFFRIAYPSGEVTYLGEYMYLPSFSPDGKYLAYSGIDYDDVVCMELEERDQLPPPGIYVLEIETGKTAYIYWDSLPEERSFIWLEKESFEEYMGDTGSFISAGNESKSCLHDLDDCREGRIPRPLGRFKFDAPLLVAGYLTLE